jgi:hypothetical protein
LFFHKFTSFLVYEKRFLATKEPFFSSLHTMKQKGWLQMITMAKTAGIGVAAFGCGVLVAFFLPESVLIVLEAGVIVTAGILFSKG